MFVTRKISNVIRDPKIISRKIHQNRKLVTYPKNAAGTHSSRRLNMLLNDRTGEYLEIGVAHGYTMEAVQFTNKNGVDPFPKCKWSHVPNINISNMTSDEYFAELDKDRQFTGIFLDGAHTFEQSYKDFLNSLQHLDSEGFILFDDTVPEDEFSALDDIAACHEMRRKTSSKRETWSGDVYKTILLASQHHPEVEIRTIITPQHPQTLITWKDKQKKKVNQVSDEIMQTFKQITHSEVFDDFATANQIFNFGFELDVLQKIIER